MQESHGSRSDSFEEMSLFSIKNWNISLNINLSRIFSQLGPKQGWDGGGIQALLWQGYSQALLWQGYSFEHKFQIPKKYNDSKFKPK